jgi:ABC-type nitrate/sulfonate/bicarbonate transport system substrate-binding protein
MVGYSAVDGSYLPLKIAEGAKLFEKHGLEARSSLVSGGGTMMNALLAGEVSVAFIGGTPVVPGENGGRGVKMILGLNNALVYQIVGGPHLQGKVNRVEDLQGKRVAISTRGERSRRVWCSWFCRSIS